MKLLITCIVLLCATFANAQTVKVKSFHCRALSTIKQGSGSVISWNSRLYVLTSDHVLYHQERAQDFCHEVSYDGRTYQADLASVHIGYGLALLTLPENVKISAYTLTAKEVRTAQEGFLQGYAFSSNSFIKTQGKVLVPSSDRTVAPSLSSVIEVLGHSEYGMSGGSFVEKNANELLGVVSHQFLKVREGVLTEHEEHSLDSKPNSQMITLVIPAQEVRAWLQRGDDQRFEASSQLQGKSVLDVEGARFEHSCLQVEPMVFLDPGSGDGVGIGGDPSPRGLQCEISITRSQSIYLWHLPQRTWLTTIAAHLKGVQKITVTGYLLNDQVYALPSSFTGFLTSLSKGAVPLYRVERGPFDSSERQRKVLTLLEDMELNLKESGFYDVDSLEKQILESHINSILTRLKGGRLELVPRSQVMAIYDAPEWGKVMLNPSVQLEALIAVKSGLLKLSRLLD